MPHRTTRAPAEISGAPPYKYSQDFRNVARLPRTFLPRQGGVPGCLNLLRKGSTTATREGSRPARLEDARNPTARQGRSLFGWPRWLSGVFFFWGGGEGEVSRRGLDVARRSPGVRVVRPSLGGFPFLLGLGPSCDTRGEHGEHEVSKLIRVFGRTETRGWAPGEGGNAR